MKQKSKQRPKINECPFRVGDVVQRRSDLPEGRTSLVPGKALLVTKRWVIPEKETLWTDPKGWEDGVIDLPFWITYADAATKKKIKDTCWVGYLELHPFLGHAKRAIRNADLQKH